jgi:hypothetical protein
MIRDCGVNRLNQFATFLAQHLRNSRQNPRLLALLQTLDDALYSGLALPREEEEWAHGNGIRLRVSLYPFSNIRLCLIFHKNLFGSTECGAMLLSTRDPEMFLQPLDGMSYAFLPVASQSEAGTSQAEHSLHLCSNLSSSRSHRTARTTPCGRPMDTSIQVIYSKRSDPAVIFPRAEMMTG